MKTAVGQFRSLTRAILTISMIALVSATQSAAQDSSTQESTYSAPQQQSPSSPPELSADQIIAILQANPEVAQNLKMAAAQNGLSGTREQAIQRWNAWWDTRRKDPLLTPQKPAPQSSIDD